MRPVAPLRPLTGIPDPPELPPGSDSRLAHYLLEGRGWIPLRVVVDLFAGVLAVVAAVNGAAAAGVESGIPASLFAMPLLLVLALAVRGMYRTRLQVVILDGVAPVVGAVSISAMIVVTATLLFGGASDIGPVVARAWVFALLFVGGGRDRARRLRSAARAPALVGKPTLIVGAGVVGTHVARRLDAQPESACGRSASSTPTRPPPTWPPTGSAPVLGSPADLGRVVAAATGARARHPRLQPPRPTTSCPARPRAARSSGSRSRSCRACSSRSTTAWRSTTSAACRCFGLRSIDPKGWQFARQVRARPRRRRGSVLIVLSPLMLAIAARRQAQLAGPDPVPPAAHRPRRPRASRCSSSARCAAAAGAERELRAVPHGPRARAASRASTGARAIGALPAPHLARRAAAAHQRAARRDEPGRPAPRAARVRRALRRPRSTATSDRHRVKSGITGWAQVHGLRGQTSLRDRVEWDNYYIENWSLSLDLKILL